jgi:hypothetical protein
MSEGYIGISISAMTASGILGQMVWGYICDVTNTVKNIHDGKLPASLYNSMLSFYK